MTPDERIAALRVRGTPRQAAFLALVLLHSGYLVRRQYTEYLGVCDGSRRTDLVETLVSRNLAHLTIYARQTSVYHLSSPSLYAAIDQEYSRHRRPAEPAVLTQKLMTLDVLIAHRTAACLATEADKVHFFMHVCQAPEASLPRRIYQSRRSGVPDTTRYFVDRVPVFLGDHPTFVYVPGWAPLGAFAAFLGAYTPLLTHVRSAQMLFCSADRAMAARARRMCERRFPSGVLPEPDPVRRARVLAHFRARQRFESRQFHTFSEPELAQLRRDFERYGGPSFDAWYQRWCCEGDAARPPLPEAVVPSQPGPEVRFTFFHLRHEYPLFGDQREVA